MLLYNKNLTVTFQTRILFTQSLDNIFFSVIEWYIPSMEILLVTFKYKGENNSIPFLLYQYTCNHFNSCYNENLKDENKRNRCSANNTLCGLCSTLWYVQNHSWLLLCTPLIMSDDVITPVFVKVYSSLIRNLCYQRYTYASYGEP